MAKPSVEDSQREESCRLFKADEDVFEPCLFHSSINARVLHDIVCLPLSQPHILPLFAASFPPGTQDPDTSSYDAWLEQLAEDTKQYVFAVFKTLVATVPKAIIHTQVCTHSCIEHSLH